MFTLMITSSKVTKEKQDGVLVLRRHFTWFLPVVHQLQLGRYSGDYYLFPGLDTRSVSCSQQAGCVYPVINASRSLIHAKLHPEMTDQASKATI